MTPQEIFTNAYTRVLDQGKPAMTSTEGCDYYIPETKLMCAVGLLLGPELAKQWSEKKVGAVASAFVGHEDGDLVFDITIPDWVSSNLGLLLSIQEAHDVSQPSDELNLDQWKEGFIGSMRSIAADYHLDFPTEYEPVKAE